MEQIGTENRLDSDETLGRSKIPFIVRNDNGKSRRPRRATNGTASTGSDAADYDAADAADAADNDGFGSASRQAANIAGKSSLPLTRGEVLKLRPNGLVKLWSALGKGLDSFTGRLGIWTISDEEAKDLSEAWVEVINSSNIPKRQAGPLMNAAGAIATTFLVFGQRAIQYRALMTAMRMYGASSPQELEQMMRAQQDGARENAAPFERGGTHFVPTS